MLVYDSIYLHHMRGASQEGPILISLKHDVGNCQRLINWGSQRNDGLRACVWWIAVYTLLIGCLLPDHLINCQSYRSLYRQPVYQCLGQLDMLLGLLLTSTDFYTDFCWLLLTFSNGTKGLIQSKDHPSASSNPSLLHPASVCCFSPLHSAMPACSMIRFT